MAKKKDAQTPAAAAATSPAADPKRYALGPQDDGSIIVRIPDDYHLMICRLSLQRHEKNATAATGTLSAIAEGDDPFLERAQRAASACKTIFINARAPENQISDTPIGKEIAEATRAAVSGDPLELVDGGSEPGQRWAPHVPTPRPRLVDVIQHPGGALVSIDGNEGYDDTFGGFNVRANGTTYAVVAPEKDGTADRNRWRLRGETYPAALSRQVLDVAGAVDATQLAENAVPAGQLAALDTRASQELVDATLLSDAPIDEIDDVDDVDESGMEGDTAAYTFVDAPEASAEHVDAVDAVEAVEDVDEEGAPRVSAPPKGTTAAKRARATSSAKTGKAATQQRERNQRSAGIPAKGAKKGKR